MTAPEAAPRSIDDELVRSIARWSVVVACLIVLFDAAILWNYPFPSSSTVLRGLFYALAAVILFVAALCCAFLGYRIVSLRFAGRSKRVYVMFLPIVALASSTVWLYLLSPAS